MRLFFEVFVYGGFNDLRLRYALAFALVAKCFCRGFGNVSAHGRVICVYPASFHHV